MTTSMELAQHAAAAALDKKATRPVVLDLRGLSDFCEVQFICSGENERQTRAIADAIEERCHKLGGVKPVAVEGKSTGNWVLMDYGGFVVHIFHSTYRDYYALEELWPKAKPFELELKS